MSRPADEDTPPVGHPIRIHYHRLPARTTVFHQTLVGREDGALITLALDLAFDPPLRIGGGVALESGSSAVWFTWPDTWHDIGRFYRADGTFTGIYANILTPPALGSDGRWETTDLCLDLWIPPGGEPRILDRDQFDEARARGWMAEGDAARALEESRRLLRAARRGRFPPPVVERWDLDRALERLRGEPGPSRQ